MKVDHTLIQSKGKGRGTTDLLQGTFTQIKDIADCKHDHIQKPEAVTGF